MSEFRTVSQLVTWLKGAPAGTQMDASTLAEILEDAMPEESPGEPDLRAEPPCEWGWREKLWVVPAERRLGTREVLEALGRGKSWLWARMAEEMGPDRFPHRKLDGELVFTAGELRAWIRDHEEVIAGGRMESTRDERRGRLEVA